MTTSLHPITLNVTSTKSGLYAQLHKAWPRMGHHAQRARAIKTITNYISDALPGDYKGDVSVFVSNDVNNMHEPPQGFLYHLTQQSIVKRRPARKANHKALLHVQYETAQAVDADDVKAKQAIPLSQIEQIKQWQQETVKAVFQCMADTALNMTAQTALRGAMAGLNKLGAMLNQQSSAAVKQAHISGKHVEQKRITSDIASTLSDLRSSLNVASTNGIKPPTKAQLAIRQQLNKLNAIIPAQPNAQPKTALVAKTAPNLKTAPSLKTMPETKTSAVQKIQTKTAVIDIKALPRITITKLETKLSREIKTAPRLAVIPARIITRVAQTITQRAAQRIAATPIQHQRTTPVTPAQRLSATAQPSKAPNATASSLQSKTRAHTQRAQSQRAMRQPAQYGEMAKPITNPRSVPRNFSHIAIAPAAILRVQIQPQYNRASTALPFTAPIAADTATHTIVSSNPVAPTPTFVAPTIEQPRSEPAQAAISNTENATPPVVTAANVAPEEKRQTETTQQPKLEAKTLEIKHVLPTGTAKLVDNQLPIPEKIEGAHKASLPLQPDKPVSSVVSG